MKPNDIPYLTENQIRGLFYIQEINLELDQKKPATISQLADNSEWFSNYFTRLHKALSPGLIVKDTDKVNTRLSLSEEGEKAVELYKDLNQVFSEAETQ